MTQENFCWSAIAAKDGRLQVVQLFMATEREKGNDFIYQNRGSASHISSQLCTPLSIGKLNQKWQQRPFIFTRHSAEYLKGQYVIFINVKFMGIKNLHVGSSSGLLGWSVTSHTTLSVDTEPFLSSCSLAYACVFVHVNLCLLPLICPRNIIKNEKRPALPQANAPHLQKSHANSTKTCCKSMQMFSKTTLDIKLNLESRLLLPAVTEKSGRPLCIGAHAELSCTLEQ